MPIKFGRRPIKSSSLRKSINLDDFDQNDDGGASLTGPRATTNTSAEEDEENGMPVVVRPSIGRSSSTRSKKKGPSSRLSFGQNDTGEDDAPEVSTPKRTLGQRALENNAIKKAAPLQNLPTRALGGDDDRPRYSKEYLDELQSSTPNTPQNLSSLRITDEGVDEDDAMALDPSELEGATIVQSTSSLATTRSSQPAATILSEAEIREKKERRARLARESDFISLDDGDSDGNSGGVVAVSFGKPKKSETSRLIAEDEDLGEGYDEFVDDGGLSLGRKAEREARRRHRREMEELIRTAEAPADDDGEPDGTDASDAERHAAYEAAQRRAGMDGMRQRREEDEASGATNVVPKMKPLPDLGDSLQRLKALVQGLEDEAARKRAKISELEKEKEEILAREKEVQDILNQAGAKYQSVMGAAAPTDASKLASASPLTGIPPGLLGDLPVERGLESFGTTPTTRPDIDGMD
jgi:hypothetical protein